MLDEKDLQALQTMVQTVVDTSAKETRVVLSKEMDKRITALETKFSNEMDKRISRTEGLLLDDLERTRTIMEKKIEAIKKNMDELSQYYRVAKLESDNTSLLLQMINDLRKEVEELKEKIA